MFPVEEIIKELNKTELICSIKKEAVHEKDWKLTSQKNIGDTNYQYNFVSGEERIFLEINKERIVVFTAYYEDFLEKLTELFRAIKYDCFIFHEKLVPINQKTNEFLQRIDVFMPYMKFHYGRYKPTIALPHNRNTIDIDFQYEKETVDLYIRNQLLASLSTIEEAHVFFETWISYTNVINDIANEALEMVRPYDNASFLVQNNSLHLCFFSREFHIGFSYYLDNGTILYYTTLFSQELGNYQGTFENPQNLRLAILEYIEKLINKTRIDAALYAKTENYLFAFCYKILGCAVDFEMITSYLDCDEHEVKRFLQQQVHQIREMDVRNIDENTTVVIGEYEFRFILYQEDDFGDEEEELIIEIKKIESKLT